MVRVAVGVSPNGVWFPLASAFGCADITPLWGPWGGRTRSVRVGFKVWAKRVRYRTTVVSKWTARVLAATRCGPIATPIRPLAMTN